MDVIVKNQLKYDLIEEFPFVEIEIIDEILWARLPHQDRPVGLSFSMSGRHLVFNNMICRDTWCYLDLLDAVKHHIIKL